MSVFSSRSIAMLCHRSRAWVTRMARTHHIGTLVKHPNVPGRGHWEFTMAEWEQLSRLCRYNKGGK